MIATKHERELFPADDLAIKLVAKPSDVLKAKADMVFSSSLAMSEDAAAHAFAEHALLALHALKPGGSVVLQVGNVFTKLTVKLIAITASAFEDCSITKPFASHATTAERFIVLRKRKGDVKKLVAALQTLCDDWPEDEFVVDLPDVELTQEITDAVFKANRAQIGQIQLRAVSTANRLAGDPRRIEKESASTKERQMANARLWFQRYVPVHVATL